jgi:protein SCO1/2
MLTVAALVLIAVWSPASAQQDGSQPLSGTSLYNLESKWVNQDGGHMALSALGGKPVVAAMGYTYCKSICPAIVADMMWIDKHLPPGVESRVQFAFISFDSIGDTPERLKLYAEGHGLDMSRWVLLSGDEDAVRELAATLGVSFRPDGQGGFDHAAVISLLDARGEIVFQQRGARAIPDELLGKLKSLIAARN